MGSITDGIDLTPKSSGGSRGKASGSSGKLILIGACLVVGLGLVIWQILPQSAAPTPTPQLQDSAAAPAPVAPTPANAPPSTPVTGRSPGMTVGN